MVEGVTTIGHEQSDLRIYVHTRDDHGVYREGILICQGLYRMIDDTVLVDSEERARKLVAAIKRRGKELGWEV